MINLPEELQVYVFSFFPPADLAKASLVCKDWHRIASDDALWKAFLDTRVFSRPRDVIIPANWKKISTLALKGNLLHKNLNSEYFEECNQHIRPWRPFLKERNPNRLGRPLLTLEPTCSSYILNFLGKNKVAGFDIYVENDTTFIFKDSKTQEERKRIPIPGANRPSVAVLEDWILVSRSILNQPRTRLLYALNQVDDTQVSLKSLNFNHVEDPLLHTTIQFQNLLAIGLKESQVLIWDLHSGVDTPLMHLKSLNGTIQKLEIFEDKIIILTDKQLLIASITDQKIIYSYSIENALIDRENGNLMVAKGLKLFLIDLTQARPSHTLISNLSHDVLYNMLGVEISITALSIKNNTFYWGDSYGNVCTLKLETKKHRSLLLTGDGKSAVQSLSIDDNCLIALLPKNEVAFFDLTNKHTFLCTIPMKKQIKKAVFLNSKIYLTTSKIVLCYHFGKIFLKEEKEKPSTFTKTTDYFLSFFKS